MTKPCAVLNFTRQSYDWTDECRTQQSRNL